MAAIQANAPHLLRYLAAAVVVTRRRRQALKELVRVVQQEGYEYSDPITEEVGFIRMEFWDRSDEVTWDMTEAFGALMACCLSHW